MPTNVTHVVHRSNLRPLPMRITQLQFEKLQALRADDGIAVQEHVRRAIDMYLADKEARTRKLEYELALAAASADTSQHAARSLERLSRLRSQYRVSRR